MSDVKQWVVNIEETENGDVILPFPPEMLTDLGWVEGDTLSWEDNGDGSWTLSKIDKK